MINFEKENVESLFKETYNRVRNLKKKTKEMVAIGVTVFMLGSFIIYDAATGVAYASGSREGTPHAIMAGDQEIAVVQSRNDAEIVVANLQETYGKNDSTTTAMITPAISIEEKEYVTAESVKIVNAQEATYSIIERNDSEEPLFEVAIKQPLVQNQVIAHDTKVVEKSDLEKGKTEIKTEGVNGAKIVLGEQSLVNGKVVSSKIYSEEVTAEPVTAVVYKGTKEKVEVQPVRSSNRSSNRSSSRKSKVSYNPSTSLGILGFAQSFHGVPYVSGGASPSGFDCSGFTMYVYRAFGINLPRSSAAQATRGVRVSASEARPGDLVVMPGHIGIYAGNGMITHSPVPGQRVKTQKIWRSATFRRLI